MALTVNLRHLELHPARFEGALSAQELGLLEPLDELIQPSGPLHYAFTAEKHERGLLLQGTLEWSLDCTCARCLRPFQAHLRLAPWTNLLPWDGEEAVVIRNDCVDLTPYLREDMVLALPQRPLCKPECDGLACGSLPPARSSDAVKPWSDPASAWRGLDNLKL